MNFREQGTKEEKMFCTTCGKETIEKGVAWYRKGTGEAVFYKECPTSTCEHTGVVHDYKKDNFFAAKYCTKCGEKEPSYEYY